MKQTKLSFTEQHHIGFYDDKGELWLVEWNDLVGTSIMEAILCFQAQYCERVTLGK